MNCNLCLTSAQYKCSCEIVFCDIHVAEHVSVFNHNFEEISLSELISRRAHLEKITSTINAIDKAQNKIISTTSALINHIEKLSQVSIDKLQKIKTYFLKSLNLTLEKEFSFDDKVLNIDSAQVEIARAFDAIESNYSFITIEDYKVDNGILEGHTEAVESVVITSDMNFIISGGSDYTIRIWNLRTQRQVANLNGHTMSVTAVAITTDNKFIVSGSEGYYYKEMIS